MTAEAITGVQVRTARSLDEPYLPYLVNSSLAVAPFLVVSSLDLKTLQRPASRPYLLVTSSASDKLDFESVSFSSSAALGARDRLSLSCLVLRLRPLKFCRVRQAGGHRRKRSRLRVGLGLLGCEGATGAHL